MGTGYTFTCSKCKHNYSASWGIGFSFPQVYEDTVKKISLSLYIPKDPEQLKIKYKLDSIDELNERPYILLGEIRAEYRILKRYVHKCDKCSGVMHRATEDELNVLPCPKCGGEPENPGYMGMIMWD